MSSLETPPPPLSSAHSPPEKPPETEIPGPSISTADSTPSSTKLNPDDRHAKVTENFKGMIFKFALSSFPTQPLSPIQRSLIEECLDEVFPSFRTPDHPPYTAMIETAIRKLDEEGTSNEEGISQYIRKEYPDLPWAHDALLKHHLGNLCENGSIVKASDGLYKLRSLVSKRDSASPPNPCSSIVAYFSSSPSPGCSPTSSGSWSSSSYSTSPRPKRKRQMYIKRRKKQRRGSKNKRRNIGKVNRTRCTQVQKRRRRTPLKKYVSENDTETSEELLMLEEKSEETEADNESEEDCDEDQIRETGLIIGIQLHKHEDMVDEVQRQQKTRGKRGRNAPLKSRCVPGKRRGRPHKEFLLAEETQPCAEEMKTDLQYHMKLEVPQEKYKIDKELADVVEDHDQVQENIHETVGSVPDDTHKIQSESVGEVNKLIKQYNFLRIVEDKKDEDVKDCDECKGHENSEVIEEQSQSKEYNPVPDQDHSNGKKRRGRPPKGSRKRRKLQLKPKCIPGRPRGRPRKKDLSVEETQPNEDQIDTTEQIDTTDIQDPILEEKTEVPAQKCDTEKEVTEVVEGHNQSQENMHERSPAEEMEMVKEIEKSGPEENELIKQCNLVEGESESDEATKGCDGQREHDNFVGSEEKTQCEEPNMVPEQGQRNQQKQRGKLLNNTKGRKIHMMYSRVPGRGRGRPRKKNTSVGESQANSEQTETIDSHEAIFKENSEAPNENCGDNKECTEVVEDCCELKGNMCGTLERSPVEKTEMVKLVRKPGAVAEENLPIKQDCSMMEGENQKDWSVEESNTEKVHKYAFDEELNKCAKERNEVTFGENQPKGQENEEQNLELEKGTNSASEEEVEVPELLGQDIQIQENIQSGGQYESITKSLLLVDVAQRRMDSKEMVLPQESFDSVLQDGKEISNKSIEWQRETEEKVLEVRGWQTEGIERKPESSTSRNSWLKSFERSSQAQYLLQQQHVEEKKPLDGQFRSHSPKSCSPCRVL